MRRAKPRCISWAAWLGIVALAVNALVPIHIAFDVAAAFGAANEHSLLAELAGHHHDHGDGHSHHHGKDHGKSGAPTACAVCLTLGSLAGFAPVAVVALKPPPPAAMPMAPALIGGTQSAAPLAYRSRAPPIV